VLSLEGLTVARGGRNVVREVSLQIPAGEVTALLGPNGAGKSSMVLSVGGIIKPVSGKVLLDGADLAGRRPERIRSAGVAIVPEGRRLLPELTVSENLRVATYTLSSSDAEAGRKRALELFPELEKRLPYAARSLSGGEQQMVAMARALMSRPRMIVMDEPTMGLSPLYVDRVLELVRTINREGVSIFMVEQNASLALEIANEAYVLQTGRIVLSGPARELKDDPRVRDAYLGGADAA
jgi:branched-chain amino acid transport system ATP-binding protein